MSVQVTGARPRAGTGVLGMGAHGPGGGGGGRQLRPWLFYAVALATFGGPLALAAQGAPTLLGSAGGSAGLATLAAVAVFGAPLWIWLRYSRDIHSAGGLFAFVEAAAGRRLALAQAAVWSVSYVLYLAYTTVQIVYDLLPAAIPGERQYQTLLALLIPVAIVGLMVAGTAPALIALAVLAVGQLSLAAALDGVTLAHIATPLSSFGTGAAAGPLLKAGAQSSLLYVCGSLPLFLGGELARPARTIRRGLTAALILTGLVVLLAVAPLASEPGLLSTSIPGVTIAREFSGNGLADAIGIGVAASTAGLIIAEYVAVTRLLHFVAGWRVQRVTPALGALMLVAAPLSLLDPEGFYSALLRPSLVALWISQLIVFAVYPRFAAKRGDRRLPAYAFSVLASGLAVYGLVLALQQATS